VRQVPELSETLTKYTTVVVLTFLTSTPNLTSQAFYGLIPGRTRGRAERNMMNPRTRMHTTRYNDECDAEL